MTFKTIHRICIIILALTGYIIIGLELGALAALGIFLLHGSINGENQIENDE